MTLCQRNVVLLTFITICGSIDNSSKEENINKTRCQKQGTVLKKGGSMHRSSRNHRSNKVNLTGCLDGIIDRQAVGQAVKNVGWFLNELVTLPKRYYVVTLALMVMATVWYVSWVMPHEKMLMKVYGGQ